MLVYFLYFFSYLSSSFSKLVTYFGLHSDDRLEGPKEELLGELEKCYSSSSFLGSYEKWKTLISILLVIMIRQTHSLINRQNHSSHPRRSNWRRKIYLGTRTRTRNIIQRENSKNQTQRSTG